MHASWRSSGCPSMLSVYNVYRPPLRKDSCWLLFREDQLRELFDFIAESNRGESASARALCEVMDEWLKVGDR